MKKILQSSLLVLFIAFASYGQSPKATATAKQKLTPAKPEEAGMSSERLARIDQTLQEYINKQWIPGAVALIVRNGQIVYYKSIGTNDSDKKDAMQKDAIFRLASQTKAITSLAVMMLYEEGHFLLDDPISKYIPEFKNPKVLDKFNEADSSYTTMPAKGEVTIRQLLTHTSGIGYGFTAPKLSGAMYAKAGIRDGFGTSGSILKDKMKILAGLPLLHNPGEKFTYGLSTDMLGYFVEVISGVSLADFFQKRIFDPLGMEDTYFYMPKSKAPRLAALYSENKEGKVAKMLEPNRGMSVNYPINGGTYYSGGAGLSSTTLDYAKFLQLFLNGGEFNGKRLISKSTVRMMTMNQIGDLSVGTSKFGLGFAIATEKESARIPVSVGSFNWGGIFNTTYWADPKEGIIGLLMTQIYPTSHGSELQDKFKVLTYQAITE